jgi:hypothetical protein
MERHELEQRLRASLQERADDVEPTPALWQRVEGKAMSRNRWRIGVMALGAAAAVAVAVLAVPMLFGGPFRVDDVPPMGTPTEPQVTEPGPGVTETEPGPGGDDSLKPFLVVTDGATLFLDEGADGGAMTELLGYGGTSEPWGPLAIAVRPGSTVDDLTVATVFTVEADLEVAVHRFVDGAAVPEFYRLGRAAIGGQPVVTPTLAWSDDGQFLAWTSFADNTGETEPTLRVLTWARGLEMAADGENPADAAANILLDSSSVTPTELRLQDWTGATATLDDQSTLWFTTLGAQAASMTVTMSASGACLDEDGTTIRTDDPTCPQIEPVDGTVEEAAFEAGAIADIGHEQNGLRYVLAVRSSTSQDAEGATISLQLEPDSDDQRMIELPEEMVPGGAAPGDRWLEVVPGGPIVVGVGTQAWILQIPDGAIENTPRTEPITPEITPLPGIIAVAGGHPGVTTTP